MQKNISIAGRTIGKNCSPYVIVEISVNHNGNIETAFRIITVVKKVEQMQLSSRHISPIQLL